MKVTKFSKSLIADNKTIKARRAQLLETTFLTELNAEINSLQREKIAAESTISKLLDFAPTNTQDLTFGSIVESDDAKRVLIEYHNAKLKLAMEIEPSIEIYEELKKDLFEPEE